MKKLAYVAGLFALTCAPLLAALYENLEVGMDKDQVLKTLRQSKQLEGPPTDALLSRTGLNGVFKTKQSIGGQTFSLNFDYDPSGGLRAVVFYSRSKCRGSEYETKLKSAYKALLVGLTEKFGEPANMPEWVAKESLQEGRIQYMHMWRVSPGVFLMSGLGNMGAMEGYFPLFRFSGPSGMPPKSKRDREELKREWAAIPEGYKGRWEPSPWNLDSIARGELPAEYLGRRNVIVAGRYGTTLLTEGFHFVVDGEDKK